MLPEEELVVVEGEFSVTLTEAPDNPAASAASVAAVLIESALAVEVEGTVTVRSRLAEAARLLPLDVQPSY
jgi:hypothetical protein